jgi:hypothetical protein
MTAVRYINPTMNVKMRFAVTILAASFCVDRSRAGDRVAQTARRLIPHRGE